ncbi:GbsR/MarR family transcriptional regulator, partial [Staphylococcus xylosus]
VYYAWLSTLSESLHNGEIFEHFPIPNIHNE